MTRRHDGPMDNPSAINDPETGWSYSGGPNTPEAMAQRLRIAEGLRILNAGGPEEIAFKLWGGEDVDPSEYEHLLKDAEEADE